MQGRAADGVAAYRVAPGAARGAEALVIAQLLRIPYPQDGDVWRAVVAPHLFQRRAPLPDRFGCDGRQRSAHPDAVQIALVVAERARGDAAERGAACRVEMVEVQGDEAAQGRDARLVFHGQLLQVAAGRPDIGQGDVIEFQPVDAELVFEVENLCLIVFRGQVIYFHGRTIFRRRVSRNFAGGKTRSRTGASLRHQCRASRTPLSRRPAMPRVNSSRQAVMATMTGILSSAYVSSA
ncbi:hypothetical protein D3C85_861000 [compost metagenome]